jgi:cytochrome c oxidase subunit 2
MSLAARAARRLSRLAPWFALVLVLIGTACSRDFPQTTLAPKGDLARIEDDIFYTTVKWATLVFVLVEGALVYAIFRFRGKPGDAEPDQIHGNTVVEIVWTVIPALILAVIAVPTVKAIFKENETPKGSDVLTVEVIGHQWWWEFRYPSLNLTTANELHVPVGRTVSLKMGAYDVIHSFWLPQFAGKRDVFPNRETRLWFTAEEPGEYTGQCAEFCGVQHGRMAFRVVAQDAAAFTAWSDHMKTLGAPPAAPTPAKPDSVKTSSAGAAVQEAAGKPGAGAPQVDSAKAAPAEDPLVAQGQKLFLMKGCVGCHSLVAYNAPQGLLGPNLANVGARTYIAAGTLPNTDENLAHWIRVPQDVKHGVLMPNLGVTEDEAKALVAFLRTHR